VASTVDITERSDGNRATIRHPAVNSHPVRVCIVYDCLYPWTVGGAERWYRNLGERLAAEGHQVTYLTRRQWGRDDAPSIPGVRVVAVSGRDELYGADGNRRVGPPLRFGAGVLRHLAMHGKAYDVVHTASFPYFSVLAAAAARRLGHYRLVVDWHEVWSAGYWKEYLGTVGGTFGYAIQRLCVRIRHQPYCFSRLHSDRLLQEGVRSQPMILEGEYAGDAEAVEPRPATPLIVFAGRMIPEKNARAAVRAIAAVRRHGAAVDGLIFGDGPELKAVQAEISRLGLAGSVRAPGFVEQEEFDRAFGAAACLLHPSSREGYGLVVVEAAARGIPVVVVAGPDNAATELVEQGVNGVIAASTSPEDLGEAVMRVLDSGDRMRQSSRQWFDENVHRLSIDSSLAVVSDYYASPPSEAG
jgi:glycosyltransferase involved in cell wall biosynthesis